MCAHQSVLSCLFRDGKIDGLHRFNVFGFWRNTLSSRLGLFPHVRDMFECPRTGGLDLGRGLIEGALRTAGQRLAFPLSGCLLKNKYFFLTLRRDIGPLSQEKLGRSWILDFGNSFRPRIVFAHHVQLFTRTKRMFGKQVTGSLPGRYEFSAHRRQD